MRLNDLLDNKFLHCAGTLLTKNVVLTAANCVCVNFIHIGGDEPFANEPTCITTGVLDGVRYNRTYVSEDHKVGLTGVWVGEHNLGEPDEGEKYIEASRIIPHENFIISNLKPIL